MMESLLVAALSADSALQAIVGDRIFAASSLGVGSNPQVPDRPYVVWNELPSIPFREIRETSNCQARLFQLWAYDEIGDWTQINAMLSHTRRICKALVPVQTSQGYNVSGQEWLGLSGLIADQTYHVNSRFGTVRFIVNS